MVFFFEKDIFRCLFFQKLQIFSVLQLPFSMTALKIVTVSGFFFFFHLPVIKYIRIKGARFHEVLIVFELYAFKCCKLTCQFVTTRTNFLVVFTQISKNRDNFCSDWNFLLKLHLVIVFMLYFHNLGYTWLFFFKKYFLGNFDSKILNFFPVLQPPFLMTVLKIVTIFGIFFHFPVVKYVRKKGAKFHEVLMNSFQPTWI